MIPSCSVALCVLGLGVLTGCGFAPSREEYVADHLGAMESALSAQAELPPTPTDSTAPPSYRPDAGSPPLGYLDNLEVRDSASNWNGNLRPQDEARDRVTTGSAGEGSAGEGGAGYGTVGDGAGGNQLVHSDLQDHDDVDDDAEWTFQTGAGFTLDPDMFLVPFVLEVRVAEDFYLGPSVQLAHANRREFLGLGVEGRVELSDPVWESDEFSDRVVPFITGGIGAAYLEKQDRAGNDDDWAPMLNAGVGAEYLIDEHVSIGSRIVFDWFLDDLVGERSMFTWQVVTLRFRF